MTFPALMLRLYSGVEICLLMLVTYYIIVDLFIKHLYCMSVQSVFYSDKLSSSCCACWNLSRYCHHFSVSWFDAGSGCKGS